MSLKKQDKPERNSKRLEARTTALFTLVNEEVFNIETSEATVSCATTACNE